MVGDASPEGFALLCEPSGPIRCFLRDDLRLQDSCAGGHFKDLVDSGSRTKSQVFLDAIRHSGAAFNWELDVVVNGIPQAMHFVGGTTDEACLICGVCNPAIVWSYLEELLQVNCEQAVHLRDVIRQVLDARTRMGASTNTFDDLSRLNNELVNVQRELYRKNELLRQLNDEKNQALGVVAHDLRNPINVLHMYTTYLVQVTADRINEEEREILSIMQRTTESMSWLVNDVLDVAAIESGQLKLHRSEVDIGDLATSIVIRQRPLARESGVGVELLLPSESLPRVQADAGKLEQVLINLLDNAVKFSPAGTDVEFRVERIADRVALYVRDHGPGIDPEVLGSLFQPFRSGRAASAGAKAGTGLGLSIAKRIVEAHGGLLEVSETSQRGTVFRISLPVASVGSLEDAR